MHVFEFIQNILERKENRHVSKLTDCHDIVADSLTLDYVQQCFPLITVTEDMIAKLQNLWRDKTEIGVFAYCCGYPILYAEKMFDIGKPAIDRLEATVKILEEGGFSYDNG